MVLRAVLIATIVCFTLTLTGTASTGVLQPTEVKVSSNALQLIEDIIKQEIHSNLVKTYLGLAPEYAASSCKQIADLKPHYDSSYYWIQGVSGAVGVYCEMGTKDKFDQSGGWMRIANVDMRNNHSQCPPGLVYNVTEGRRLCRKLSLAPGCSSTTFSTQGVEYNKVCGKVIGYQYYVTYGFGPSRYTPGINETYVDGVSITHGSPRQHVWSFAAANYELSSKHVNCRCLHPLLSFTGVIPSFVGEDYYCETGSRTSVQQRYYFDDPLWDGEGCEGENECCDRGGPWFCKQLPQPTRNDIKLRVCTNNGNEDVVLEQIEFYIQ